MITCHLRYVIEPSKLDEFEIYSRVWITLVTRFGGIHHGYLMPSEGVSNIALASFSFPSFADYEVYRNASFTDDDCKAAFAYAKRTQCIVSFERSFFRPVTAGLEVTALQPTVVLHGFL
jgi:NIPSNAP